ncbi:MAG: protein-tyrosine-phosphatase [Flavobacteriales bacterium]|jgi:arsenate reductase (thioredoxin)|nr:protein-tyrosine-phosphatase [Flavobacteriales bacterium]MBT3963112.1 protein-tyrosine-phosphatase [Flavobacteriales bacterium]MBT4706066.1 protein-tyrosine-phosphatase [Flavobacteriales bacterium]MBT4930687.1 protein-tyrosine-phosphatase [Flavobacteriales bacterium]MBT5133367.1 protein-tyrosine-phosphatase [Flavobacteriales bacterium]
MTEVNTFLDGLQANLSEERAQVLEPLVSYISERQLSNETCRLNFICTHNARRSHMAQLWAAAAAVYSNLDGMEFYSGGVEVTRFHPNAIASMSRAGFNLLVDDESKDNPLLFFQVSDGSMLELFSKRFDDEANPQSDFAAVMVCSDAETNCPYVPGADKRMSVTYDDPKVGDGKSDEAEIYDARSRQIAAEMLFVMREVSKKID